jgi:hypothetical protein
MDIETVKIDNKQIPYCICGYNGYRYITSYATPRGTLPKDQSKLFSMFINKLLDDKFSRSHNLIVYAHNLSGFDGIFIMKHLLKFGRVRPLLHNGKLISIRLRVDIKGHKGKTIIFKDSFLMLPLSLRNLCNSFKVESVKAYFPYLLNDLNYKGQFPDFNLFTSLSTTEYKTLKNQYFNKIWSFKTEAMKYCELDCVSLHQIISKFSVLIFNNFKVDPIKVLTLPALAMKIWKMSFMPKDTVYQIHNLIEYNIRQSYTGGAVDVYIPHNKDNETLYYYDVNGLYPSVMLNNPMPTGKPIAFLGDIRKTNPSAFGFFYCNINSPTYLEHPILQRSIKTSNGIRTIAGLGTWQGWIFSAEMDNAVKFGYKFEILKGYKFKKGNLFFDYVNNLYNLRLNYPKGDPMNLIAKLLMNSLYGKFGMKDEMTKLEIFDNTTDQDKEFVSEIIDTYGTTVNYINEFGNFIIICRNYSPIYYNEKNDLFHGSEVNIAIASAITAYARIHMSYFKNNPDFKLYYSDTDSAITNKPIPNEMVGKELGQMKLEYKIKKAVFLAPKVYGLITDTGEEIIKVKGLSKDVNLTFDDLEKLLIKDSSKILNQEKWNKSIINGEIKISSEIYTLSITSNKRQAIYINDKFDKTEPFYYDNIL